jgi:ATP-dependent Clp protease ATP-binding subunit ClpC
MFERYTEKGRRAIFFARYEGSMLGIEWINPDCLLLGLVRENREISTKWLGFNATELHHLIESQTITSKQLSTSVDLPLKQ